MRRSGRNVLFVLVAVVVVLAAGLAAALAGGGRRSRPVASPARLDTVDVSPVTSTPARNSCLDHVAAGEGPLMVAVGASYTAGVGSGSGTRSWGVDLARFLGWRAVVAGDSGLGYVHRGNGGLGPLRRYLPQLDLPALHPAMVIVQAGHDDGGSPLVAERAAVRRAWRTLRAELPGTRLVAITAFDSHGTPTRHLRAVDRVIAASVHRADPAALVIDPLAEGWNYPRSTPGGLHPSALGDRDIAHRVLADLLAAGVRKRPTSGPVCVLAPPARHHRVG